MMAVAQLKARFLGARIEGRARSPLGRLIALTGARQTGKTTLVQRTFPQIPYLSMEDPAVRPAFSRLSARDWIERYPVAIIDEVQKAPSIVESIKAAYDASDGVRYLLLGSSQILLLSRIRESLAGRVAIEELWPLTLPEMATSSWADPLAPSRLVAWLDEGAPDVRRLLGVPASDGAFAPYAEAFDTYLRYGGMPAIWNRGLTPHDRDSWLLDYRRTYLERDVADLVSLRDLEPFVVAQKAIALATGRLVNFSDLARAASISPATARRFLRYLELSYQALLLPPYFRNPQKRLTKTPKVHILDPGVLRAITGRTGELSGEEFESAVVAEIYKQCRTAGLRVDFLHLRTRVGREVDLLLETGSGFVACEIKQSRRVTDADARGLRGLEEILDRPLLGSFLLSMDPDVRRLAGDVLAMPAAWALSPPAPAA
jgi:uncharacterized protein